MIQKFSITYKGAIYRFEFAPSDGIVWLIDENKIPSKTNLGQEEPAKNLDEARIIAKQMLHALGY